MEKKSIWITWERQRRSIELARAFGAKYYELLKSSDDIPMAPVRYLMLSLKTIFIIFRERPKIIFAQNPSIVLAGILCAVKNIGRYKLVIDRHSNFKLESIKDKKIKWQIFHYLSKYTVKTADLTIVTNEYLARLVNLWQGISYILQDKLPELKEEKSVALAGEINIVFISTFSADEPIEEIIKTADRLDNSWVIYITGNYKGYNKIVHAVKLLHNVVLTGYLPEKEYQRLLFSADLVVVLTMQEHTLNCGAYEAISLGKPLVLSDTEAIRSYFRKGVIYSEPYAVSIEESIRKAIENKMILKDEIMSLRNELKSDWNLRFQRLKDVISQLQQ